MSFNKSVDCSNGLGIVLVGTQPTCWAKPKSEDQRNNRRTPKYFLKRSCLFQDEPIFMILTSVISLRSFNHEACPPSA